MVAWLWSGTRSVCGGQQLIGSIDLSQSLHVLCSRSADLLKKEGEGGGVTAKLISVPLVLHISCMQFLLQKSEICPLNGTVV